MPRSAVGAIVGGLTLAVLAAAGPVRAQDAQELLDDGRRAFEREDFDTARDRLWAYLDATANLSGAARLPQAEALYYIARMEPDAAVATQHYEIIIDEFLAASVADRALHRLGMLELASGRTAEARARFERLQRDYPFSRVQPELPLWLGRVQLAEGDPAGAAETFDEGFRRIRSQDLPRELNRAQREAMAAEYAHWLATAYFQAGDEEQAQRYYALLTLDYPDSPQAAEARETLATLEGAPLPNPTPPSIDRPTDEPRPTPVAVAPPAEFPAGRAEAPPEEVEEAGEIEVAVADPGAEAPRGVGQGAPTPQPDTPRVEPEPDPEPTADPPAGPVEREAPAQAVVEREVERAEERAPAPQADDEPPAKFAPQPEGGRFIQVGAFTSASRAADLSKRLKAEGFPARIQVAVVDGQGFYRVRVGPFRDGDPSLDTNRDRLRARGYPTELVTGE